MIRILLSAAMALMLFVSQAHACLYQPQGGDDLYDVFNHFFLDGSQQQAFASDIELLNSSYFIPNGQDTQWMSAGDVLRVDATYREAGFWQELGYVAGDGYAALIGAEQIANKTYTPQDVAFTVEQGFMWSDTIGVRGYSDPIQRWYAAAAMNPLGGKDHFLAFAIDDDDLLQVFNRQFGTDYHAGIDDVWMIAFEDLNLGDADYTDLVAVIARPGDLNPVPVPAAGVLLASALGGMACLPRRRAPLV